MTDRTLSDLAEEFYKLNKSGKKNITELSNEYSVSRTITARLIRIMKVLHSSEPEVVPGEKRYVQDLLERANGGHISVSTMERAVNYFRFTEGKRLVLDYRTTSKIRQDGPLPINKEKPRRLRPKDRPSTSVQQRNWDYGIANLEGIVYVLDQEAEYLTENNVSLDTIRSYIDRLSKARTKIEKTIKTLKKELD